MIDEHESILFIEAMCGSKLVRRPEINVPGLHLASADQRLTKKSCRDPDGWATPASCDKYFSERGTAVLNVPEAGRPHDAIDCFSNPCLPASSGQRALQKPSRTLSRVGPSILLHPASDETDLDEAARRRAHSSCRRSCSCKVSFWLHRLRSRLRSRIRHIR